MKIFQHIFSSVEYGLFPDQGRGFQTVAASPELSREELRVLEENSYYSLSREKLDAGNFPIKETFFALPNDRLALGRTTYIGVDALGRDGNYLTHHLIFDRADFSAGVSVFAILEALPFAGSNTDLTPREIAAVDLQVTNSPLPEFDNINADVLALLTASAIDRGTKSLLLIGESTETRKLIKAMHSAISATEALELTFSTRYDESVSPKTFAITAAETLTEATAARNDFVTVDLMNASTPPIPIVSAYATLLLEAIKSRNSDSITALNQAFDLLRKGQNISLLDSLKQSPQTMSVLWERTGDAVLTELLGKPELIAAMMQSISTAPQSFADALMKTASPSKLCGQTSPEKADEFISMLKSKASSKSWSEWTKRWPNDPLLNNKQKQGWLKKLLGG
ncbi:MAG TPA: hypothetical protein VEF04_08880 [Blastocatellia bacterium]|nr:hypothetical protein [Blastocatellia bacterium]